MNLDFPKGDNITNVSQSAGAHLIALLLTSKFVAVGMTWAGIPATPENIAEIAVLANTTIASAYTWFASSKITITTGTTP